MARADLDIHDHQRVLQKTLEPVRQNQDISLDNRMKILDFYQNCTECKTIPVEQANVLIEEAQKIIDSLRRRAESSSLSQVKTPNPFSVMSTITANAPLDGYSRGIPYCLPLSSG